MTMHKRRSLFVTGILLSALVLFGSTAAFAQIPPAVFSANAFEAVALDHDSIRVRWGIDSNEARSADIEEFEIRYQKGTTIDDAESWMIMEADEEDRSIVIDDLDHSTVDEMTSYVFQVRALDPDATESDDRRSIWQPTSPVLTESTEVAEPPEQVEDLELVEGDMMIMASWEEADTDSDFPLTGYELTIEPKDGPKDTMNIGVMEEYTFEGLMNDTEYTITVAARNEIGRGEPSEEEKATPMMPTPALTLFGALALGAGLVAAGRRRLRRRRQQLLAS